MLHSFRSPSLCALVVATTLLGCASSQKKDDTYTPPTPPEAMGKLPAPTGFLSTYTNLEPAGPSSLRYLDPNNRLARYNKFRLAPIEVRFYESGARVSPENEQMLVEELGKAIVRALSDRYPIVTTPGYDVGELRVALTDIKRSTPILNVIPRPKLSNIGLGGLAMEAEVVDSESNVQITALVESSLGRNLAWNPTQWDDAIGAMNDWAQRFRRAVDAAHAAK